MYVCTLCKFNCVTYGLLLCHVRKHLQITKLNSSGTRNKLDKRSYLSRYFSSTYILWIRRRFCRCINLIFIFIYTITLFIVIRTITTTWATLANIFLSFWFSISLKMWMMIDLSLFKIFFNLIFQLTRNWRKLWYCF